MRKQIHTRAVLGALTILGMGVLASCDSRQVIAPPTGNGVPSISIEVPSARDGAVGIDQPVGVTVRASHGLSLLAVFDTAYIENGALVRRVYVDSVRFTSTTTTNTRQFSVPVTGSVEGEQLRIVAYAVDGSRNVVRRDTVFTFSDNRPRGVLEMLTPSDSTTRTMLGTGDSVLARVAATAMSGIHTIAVTGYSVRGSATTRLDTIAVYEGFPETFPTNPTEVTAYRQLKPNSAILPTDTVVFFRARITDVSGRAGFSNAVNLRRVTGPNLAIEQPLSGLTRSEGDQIVVDVLARDSDGVRNIRITVDAGSGPQLLHDTTISHKQDSLRLTTTYRVPDGTEGRDIRFTAQAWDLLNVEGPSENRTVRIVGLGADETPPVVRQILPVRIEMDDTLRIDASDERAVRRVGFEARALDGTLLSSDTVTFAGTGHIRIIVPFVLNGERAGDTSPERLAKVAAQTQALLRVRGQQIVITSWADDTAGNRGYTSRTLNPQPDPLAVADSMLLVFGTTHALPRGGRAADIAVDPLRNNVFISNVAQNVLDVWLAESKRFDPTAIMVGSQPWGLAVDAANDRLFVANSGGTTISVVSFATRLETGRLNTPNRVAFEVGYNISPSNVRKYTLNAPVDYSDRPQYIAQSQNGNIYFSTRPTSAAQQGTLRRLDPDLPVATVRQILNYAMYEHGKIIVVNAENVLVRKGASAELDDQIAVCGKPFGGSTVHCSDYYLTIIEAVDQLRADYNSDVEYMIDGSLASLALTDTTFVAVGGDQRVIAFGEGATSRPGRVITVTDPVGTAWNGARYSTALEVADLINNASDRVYGVAVNQNSSMVGVHGIGAFFADETLRLKGSVAMGGGAGIAFHPHNTNQSGIGDVWNLARSAYVAENNLSIAVMDTYFFRRRGTIALKENITGPIRTRMPTAAEVAEGYSLVLYGLTASGLVVIPLKACDIDNSNTTC